jgi:formate/nitrite transporter FocA (FNT family)
MADQQAELKSTRRSAPEILEQVIKNGEEELARSSTGLVISGIAGGVTMGLTGLGVAVAKATLGPGMWQDFIAHFLYPIGFISVIIGRAQLFTENTLYPVVIVLEKPRQIGNLLRLWAAVFLANVVGALLFSLLAVRTPALKHEYARELVDLGLAALASPTGFVFWSGVIGGWIIALVAWMVSASHWTIGQIALVFLLTFVVGLGHFAHCIATSGEILSAVVAGNASVGSYLHWLFFATMGNILGGAIIVSLLNYGQVKAGDAEE